MTHAVKMMLLSVMLVLGVLGHARSVAFTASNSGACDEPCRGSWGHDVAESLANLDAYQGALRTHSWDALGQSYIDDRLNRPLNDPVGNRLSYEFTPSDGSPTTLSYSYDANDRLAVEHTYDANGNTLTGIAPTGEVIQDEYDYENRLIRRRRASDGTVLLEFHYDAAGNRLRKFDYEDDRKTIYHVAEHNTTGYSQVLTEYRESISTGGSTSYLHYFHGVDLYAMAESGTLQTKYYGYDAHGNVRYLTDENGSVTDTYTYDAYGNVIAGNLVDGDPYNDTENHYLYTGEQYDPDLGLYYLRARYYSTQLGRFWSMDSYEGSLSNPLSLNKYVYTEGNPINMVDPSGKFGVMSAGIGASIGASIQAMHMEGVTSIGFAMSDAIMGIEEGKSAEAVLQDYWFSTAIGLGAGAAIGGSMKFMDSVFTRMAATGKSTVRKLLHAVFGPGDYWRFSGGVTWSRAMSEAAAAGVDLAKGSIRQGSRNLPGTNKVRISPADMVDGEVNRIMLAEEFQHAWDRLTHEASRANRRGTSPEGFHADVFRRIIDNWDNGKLQFLTAQDIAALRDKIIPFLERQAGGL